MKTQMETYLKYMKCHSRGSRQYAREEEQGSSEHASEPNVVSNGSNAPPERVDGSSNSIEIKSNPGVESEGRGGGTGVPSVH